MNKQNDTRSLVESLIDSMVKGDYKSTPSTTDSKDDDTITIEEGDDVVCPDCGSKNMIEGFVESEDSDSASLAYACAECDLKLVSDQEYDFTESQGSYEAEIDPDDPKCPNCSSSNLSHQMVESKDGSNQLILDCGGCGAAMSVISDN
jgi:DNA-directed RNA polymerase subunit RPC12/RpoP